MKHLSYNISEEIKRIEKDIEYEKKMRPTYLILIGVLFLCILCTEIFSNISIITKISVFSPFSVFLFIQYTKIDSLRKRRNTLVREQEGFIFATNIHSRNNEGLDPNATPKETIVIPFLPKN